MDLLLDTHALLWFGSEDRRLSRRAAAAPEAEDAVLHISAATVWELSIKTGLGRLQLALSVERLPLHQRDPFDRLLAVQALSEAMPLVTRNKVFKKYGVQTAW